MPLSIIAGQQFGYDSPYSLVFQNPLTLQFQMFKFDEQKYRPFYGCYLNDDKIKELIKFLESTLTK